MKLPLSRPFTALFALLFMATMSVAQSPTPGTYRLFLCAASCLVADSTQAFATATIVIADDSMAATSAWKSAMSALQVGRMRGQSGPMDNACFRVERQSRTIGSEELFFGIRRNGSTHREAIDGGGFAMRVYHMRSSSLLGLADLQQRRASRDSGTTSHGAPQRSASRRPGRTGWDPTPLASCASGSMTSKCSLQSIP